MPKLLFAGLLLCLIFLTIASSKQPVFEKQQQKKNHDQQLEQDNNLDLYFSKFDKETYTAEQKIEDSIAAAEMITILDNAPWRDAKVVMSRQPDYKIRAVKMSPTTSPSSLTYAIWLSQNKNFLEIIIENQNKASKLTQEDSAALLSILKKLKLI